MEDIKLSEKLNVANIAIQNYLTNSLKSFGSGNIVDGMRYALLGGKGLRGFLVMESAALMGVTKDNAISAAAAVEALHTYSLVHDDLPCMDDDDLRRGIPTIHKKWDEATAVLVGDALQTFAFELLSQRECSDDPNIRINLISSLARAVGAQGMVLGQAQDIEAESSSHPLGLDDISELQRNKTGALIEWSAVAGAILACEDPKELREYSQALGLAFQIVDDILDVEGDSNIVGKAVGKDNDAGKATFVSLLGLAPAKLRAQALADEACNALEPFGDRALTLKKLAQFVVSREK
jgi:farnesyl diphosphate synthase